MKALAIDTAAGRISFTAQNGDCRVSLATDSQRQSQVLLPCIDNVMKQAGLAAGELEFTALASGPGSFTGLRLAFAALKGIELAHGCPVYGVPTMTAYAYAYKNWPGAVVPVLDAKKERFYAAVFRQGREIAGPVDKSCADILQFIDPEENVLLCGDAELFYEAVKHERPAQNVIYFENAPAFSVQVLCAAAAMRERGEVPLADYDGPLYIRKSEAEENFKK